MEFYDQLFLQALKAALKGEKVQWNMDISHEDWFSLLNQAQVHNVLALVYDVVYQCPAARSIDEQLRVTFKKRMVYQVIQQTVKTEEFLRLQHTLRDAGMTPVVVKGIICRNLYPNPDYRISADEDILIPRGQFAQCHQLLCDYGMHLMKPKKDIETAYEVSYRKSDSPIYIELHKSLFDSSSKAYGEWNQYFTEVFDRVICEDVKEGTVLTLDYTDHLFYLICHSFKHFLHSGFGIRQVCDITLFANKYGSNINWQKVIKLCREIHAEKFAVALFKIGQNYLTFDPKEACYPKQWEEMDMDEMPMLLDLLSSGIYGDSSMSRKHSSNMTLNAVTADKKGIRLKGNVFRVVFPKAKALEFRYGYLKKYPYLLPIAWVSRLFMYGREVSRTKNNDAAESLRIGNKRIELLKQYGVIERTQK